MLWCTLPYVYTRALSLSLKCSVNEFRLRIFLLFSTSFHWEPILFISLSPYNRASYFFITYMLLCGDDDVFLNCCLAGFLVESIQPFDCMSVIVLFDSVCLLRRRIPSSWECITRLVRFERQRSVYRMRANPIKN